MNAPSPSVTLPAGSVSPPPHLPGSTPSSADLISTGVNRSGKHSSEMEQGAGVTPLADLSAPFERLPVSLIVSVPVRSFRVKHLLAIDAGTVIESQWNHGEDIPLASGEVQLAWSEFEVVDGRLAVRVTRLT